MHTEDRFCEYCGAELTLKTGKSKRLIFIIVPSIICLGVLGGFALNYYFDRSDKDNIIWLPGLKKTKFDREKDQNYDIIVRYQKKGSL